MLEAHVQTNQCSRMAEASWDNVQKLRQELKKQKETRDYLLTTTERMKKAVYESQLILKDIPKEDNVWKDRVEEQQTYNRELESELALLEKKYKELRTQFEANSQSSEPAYDDMSDSKMRLLLKQLEKEKESVERQLKDCEWRLDQEAASRYKAEDEKKKILTQLEHIRSQEAVGKPPS